MIRYCITMIDPRTGGSRVVLTNHAECVSEYEMMAEVEGKELVFINEFQVPDPPKRHCCHCRCSA